MSWIKKAGAPQIKREVHEIDAAGKVVGRLATEIATLLMGKNKPSYVPHIDSGAVIKVKNAAQLVLTGKKWETKKHFRTSGRPGGLKATLASTLRETDPGEVLKHAVKFMLPKNSTQAARLKRLIIE